MKAITINRNRTGKASPKRGIHELVSGEMVGTNPESINSTARVTVAGNAMMLISFIGLDWL
jgi:hypothetical protein